MPNKESKRSTRNVAPERSTRKTVVEVQPRSRKKTYLLAGTLAFFGVMFLLYQPVINALIGPAQLEKVQANALSDADVQGNSERLRELSDKDTLDHLFDYESVEMIDTLSVVPSIDSERIVGGIYVPGVDMLMPIMYGVSHETLLSAAGTMKPSQEMGLGNYALIGHNSKNAQALFAPVHRIAEGDVMYVTDKDAIYEYTFISSEVVDPTNVGVIDDVNDKTTLTLITCTADGKQRVVVQGELTSLYHFSDGLEDVKQAFDQL